MENIDVLIYSSPKTAGNILKNIFIKSKYNVYYTHNSNFFTNKFPGQDNKFTLKTYIEKESENKKLTIIMVYREYVERIVSLFFESFENLYNASTKDVNDVPTNELIDYFNNNVITKFINYNDYNCKINEGFFELFPEEVTNFKNNYNKSEGYSVWSKENIQFVVLKFSNIKNWESNLFKIFDKQIEFKTDHSLLKINTYSEKYDIFKSSYVLPKKIYSKIYEEFGYPTLFANCLTTSEKISFSNKHKIHKTLIGKSGYLFLQNDSGKELLIHDENLCTVKTNSLNRYEKYLDKFLLTVFPNKSLKYKDFLPDGFEMKFRPGFNIYNEYFKGKIIDGLEILKYIDNTFYKTDTHINLNGAYVIYCEFVKEINTKFNINVNVKNITILKDLVKDLNELNIGIGDLTWEQNLGNQTLDYKDDIYYYSNDFTEIYLKYTICLDDKLRLLLTKDGEIIDETNEYIGKIVDWNVISKYIIYNKSIGKPKYKCLIFYDSFLLSTLGLYLELFEEVYLSKSTFCEKIIELIKPDYIFEFRVERFLV